MIGIFILVIATLSYLSLTVVTHKSQVISKDESKAAQLAGRLIEQIQLLTTRDINVQTLTALNLVDNYSVGSPYSFTNIPLDEGTRYSPALALTNGKGVMTVTKLENESYRVVATISWTSKTGVTKSYTTGTIVGSYR
jgi:hypothetical protein